MTQVHQRTLALLIGIVLFAIVAQLEMQKFIQLSGIVPYLSPAAEVSTDGSSNILKWGKTSSRQMPPFDVRKIEEGPVNSIAGTTGSGVPGAVKQVLQSTGENIDEDAKTFFGSKVAVDALEEKCGWNATSNDFNDKSCFGRASFKKMQEQLDVSKDLIDIVTPSIRNLDFLNDWREFFQGFHVIIIQDGDPNVHLEIPEWVDYELYNRNDIKAALGSKEWIISNKDASIRNFGFLVSKKPYIYTIDDDCRPALDSDGFAVNPIHHHLKNLLAPSNPYFFNTLYDPYNEASDFVRGYPYSLRDGVPTVVSHGLWMQTPDYDAPTQLLKPEERVTKMHDMAVTIPAHVFYPMCSMNVAFSRELIGPAFMQGLMGEGHPWARYDDMFAGWASKAVADHLGLGVKSGKPYIRHNKASNPFTNLQKEYKGLWWQEEIIRFFHNDVSFSEEATTPQKAYTELAGQIRDRFNSTHEYFGRLANAMELWIGAWDDMAAGKLNATPSRVADNSLIAKYGHLNTKGSSHYRKAEIADATSAGWFQDMQSFFGPRAGERCVNDGDIAVGRTFKAYLFPLDSEFHIDPYKAYDIWGCLFESCSKDELARLPAQYQDYFAEIIILRKLLSSLVFTMNPEDADLIVVPALSVTMLGHFRLEKNGKYVGCRNHGSCKRGLFSRLDALTNDSRQSGKKHLFLGSQDSTQNHDSISRLEFEENVWTVTLGPSKNLVVPSLNSADWLQPNQWTGSKPVEKRPIYVTANFGRAGKEFPDREKTMQQLQLYSGDKNIAKSFGTSLDDTIFVLCLPGDLPFVKRFFDTLLAGAIPVVVRREYDFGGSYWDLETNHGKSKHLVKWGPPSIENSYPSSWASDIADIVVELTPEMVDSGKIMEVLESIPMEEIKKKIAKIEEMHSLFLYDFSGTERDAFSVMLEDVSKWVVGSSP